jgi:hypothetical protein
MGINILLFVYFMRFNNEFLKKIPFSKYIAFFSIEGTKKGGSKFELCFIYKYPTLWVIDGLLKNVCLLNVRHPRVSQILQSCTSPSVRPYISHMSLKLYQVAFKDTVSTFYLKYCQDTCKKINRQFTSTMKTFLWESARVARLTQEPE